MRDIDLGALARGPHANLIRDMAGRCAADRKIQAIWVGGSLAAGTGDIYSDIDFRIAVEPGEIDSWTSPDWRQYLPDLPCGGVLMRFGDQALLHHLVLANGTIVDFYVQDTERQNFEPKLVILACRNAEFRARLEGFSRPAAPLVKEIVGAVARQFFIDYWITTHKQVKALARDYHLSPFIGLYWERTALLRAWYMQVVGKDIDARASLHMLGKLHQGLEGKISADQHDILGLPSRSADETMRAIGAIRTEMARVGRELAARHAFVYPHELEAVVRSAWNAYKASLTPSLSAPESGRSMPPATDPPCR